MGVKEEYDAVDQKLCGVGDDKMDGYDGYRLRCIMERPKQLLHVASRWAEAYLQEWESVHSVKAIRYENPLGVRIMGGSRKTMEDRISTLEAYGARADWQLMQYYGFKFTLLSAMDYAGLTEQEKTLLILRYEQKRRMSFEQIAKKCGYTDKKAAWRAHDKACIKLWEVVDEWNLGGYQVWEDGDWYEKTIRSFRWLDD